MKSYNGTRKVTTSTTNENRNIGAESYRDGHNASMMKIENYLNKKNIRAVLFILIGCLSFYYSTQCVFYDQFNGFRSIYFGEDKIVVNKLSSQIGAVGFQARGDGQRIISLMQDLFIIIGLVCITFGATSINIRNNR